MCGDKTSQAFVVFFALIGPVRGMKRKQVLGIDAISSVLVVENELAPTEAGVSAAESGAPVSDLYVMRRYNGATWTAPQMAEAVGQYDRLIDLEPPIRHLVKHHSVITQRGHINLVISYCPQGSLMELCNSLRSQRLSGIPSASRNRQCTVSPADVRAWFLQAATAVCDLHGHGFVHGNPRLPSLLCSGNVMPSSEDGMPSCLASPPIPLQHAIDRWRLFTEKQPTLIATHIPPECRTGALPTAASDIWLLGDLMLDLVLITSLGAPFAPDDLASTPPQVKAKAIGDEPFRRYVLTMMADDAGNRPNIAEVLAAAPLLNWTNAIVKAGDVEAATGEQPLTPNRTVRRSSSQQRSSSAPREASRQPASPVRNPSPPRPGDGDFPLPPTVAEEATRSYDESPARSMSPPAQDPTDEGRNGRRGGRQSGDNWHQRTNLLFEELDAIRKRQPGEGKPPGPSTPLASVRPRHRALAAQPVETIELDTSAAPTMTDGPSTPILSRRRPTTRADPSGP
jgi:serine/threonine protein kinase